LVAATDDNTDVTLVQVGALKILRELCSNKRVCVTLKQFGGIMSLIDLLQDTDKQVV